MSKRSLILAMILVFVPLAASAQAPRPVELPRTITFVVPFGAFSVFGTRYKSADLILGWNYETRNRAIFATRGIKHSLSM